MTELEHCALGVIWQRGPCTAYAVRNEFAKSPSAYWSASSGSIYPVIKRLLAAGLIEAQTLTDGRRVSRALQVTTAGLDALRLWIEEIDRAATSATYDPIRTRMLFLDALTASAEREAVLDKAAEETKSRLAELKATARSDEPMEMIAMLGAVYELKARLEWLQEIRPQLVGQRGASPGNRK
jgi:DNA-binding PadR family transcriptional regulator